MILTSRRAMTLLTGVGLSVFATCAQAQAATATQSPSRNTPQRDKPVPRRNAPNATAIQNAAQNTGQNPAIAHIAPIPLKNPPDNPLRTAIRNAIEKAVQEAGVSAAGTYIQNAAQNATAGTTPNAAAGTLPSTAAGTMPNNIQNAVPNAAQDIEQNAAPNAMRATNPTRREAASMAEVPAEFQPAITAMENAQTYLQQSGNKWGGYKVKGANLINQALIACGQPASRPDQAPSSPGTEAAAMQAMQAAISQLNNAKSAFANSTEPWGGRPAKAGPLIDQALSELKKALDFAASKNTQ